MNDKDSDQLRVDQHFDELVELYGLEAAHSIFLGAIERAGNLRERAANVVANDRERDSTKSTG